MKNIQTNLGWAVLVLSLLGCGAAWSQASRQLTEKELLALRNSSKARQIELQASTPKENKSHPSKSGILDRSTVIVSGGNWTIVPKGALLYVPQRYQNCFDVEGTGTFLDFKEFFLKNRSWLVTHSVTLEQARGKSALSEQTIKGFVTSGRAVVSVFRGGPISTRPYKEETVAKTN